MELYDKIKKLIDEAPENGASNKVMFVLLADEKGNVTACIEGEDDSVASLLSSFLLLQPQICDSIKEVVCY